MPRTAKSYATFFSHFENKLIRRSPMETPLLKVSRPVSACARCRNAKIRCDGKLPACSACERAGKKAECSSANDHFAKGKERSYVASLESRIEKLEKQIAASQGQKMTAQYTTRRHSSIDHSLLRGREAEEVDDLVSDFGFLYVEPIKLMHIGVC